MATLHSHSPTIPSPSPSPSSPSPSRTWQYPGPSTKFTKRERNQTLHTRWKSTYTPTAPVLSTERRAHRRTQSSAQVATTTSRALPTPPASTCSDYYARSPLSRFSSYVNAYNSDDATMAPTAIPVTPAKQSDTRRIEQDSPFSDYFTDDARSVIHEAPSSETQHLLVQLHKLQSYLMRSNDDTEREALNILGRKMGEIDLELNALHSQTRPLLEDSGLFMDDEEEEEDEDQEQEDDNTPDALSASARSPGGLDGTDDLPDEPRLTPSEKRAELDFQLLEAQRVLAQVSAAQEQLRQRHAELRELNDMHILRIEEREQEIEELRSENEALKSDLGFDHSELLFLKLQFKALEVEVDSLDDDSDNDGSEPKEKRSKRSRIAEEMKRWRSDWHDVDARFRRRRSSHRVMSADHKEQQQHNSLETELDGNAEDGEQWQLETVKKGMGRVQSITIRRLPDCDSAPLGLDGAVDDEGGAEGDGLRLPPPAVLANAACQTEKAAETKGSEYVEQSTQTDVDLFSIPSPLTLSDIEPFPVYRDAFESDENDCAITTSSTTRNSSPTIRAMEKDYWGEEDGRLEKPEKTAWQELWEGLANVAGGSFQDD